MAAETNKAHVLERFRKDTADHRMIVLRNDGLYRHIRFRKPDANDFWFDIVTWPGYLAISGDMGESMFARLEDMFVFFRQTKEQHDKADGLYINPSYWHEKCVANGDDAKGFSPDRLASYLRDAFGTFVEEREDDDGDDPKWADDLWAEIERDIIAKVDEAPSVQAAIEAMSEFTPGNESYADFHFSDAWEATPSLEEYTFHFLWRLCAISYAVRAYDNQRERQRETNATTEPEA